MGNQRIDRALRRLAPFLRIAGKILLIAVTVELLIRGHVWWVGEQNLYQSDPVLGWRVKPNLQRAYVSKDGPYLLQTNSRGMRDFEHPFLSEDGRLRVLALGSSTVFGDSIDQSKTITSQLAERLPDAEVINLSIPSSSIDQHYLMLKEEGLAYLPQVVLHFMIQTDATDPFWSWQYIINRPKCWLGYDAGRIVIHPPTTDLLPRIVEASYLCKFGALLSAVAVVQFRVDDATQHDLFAEQELTSEERSEALRLLIRQTREICRLHGAEYVVAYIPSVDELTGERNSAATLLRDEVLGRMEAEESLTVVDIWESGSDELRSLAGPIYEGFHLNTRGHTFVSEKLATRLNPVLKQRQKLPDSAVPVSDQSDEG